MIEVGEFYSFRISLSKRSIGSLFVKKICVPSSPNSPQIERKECGPSDRIVIIGVLQKFSCAILVGKLKKREGDGYVTFILKKEVHPEEKNMTTIKENEINVFKRVVTVGTRWRNIDTSMSKGDSHRKTVMVNKSEEKLEFIRYFGFPDPTQVEVN